MASSFYLVELVVNLLQKLLFQSTTWNVSKKKKEITSSGLATLEFVVDKMLLLSCLDSSKHCSFQIKKKKELLSLMTTKKPHKTQCFLSTVVLEVIVLQYVTTE